MPRKTFVAGDVLTASDMNTFLMDQSVMTFADSAARGSAIGTATEGMVTYLEDTDGLELWNGAAWVSATPASGGSGNAIINGAFDIWQRGTTFTNMTNTTYAPDRWRVNTADATIDVSRSTFTLGEAPVSGLDGKFFASVAAEATDTDPRFTQAIEGVQSFEGQTITVSFYAKSTVTTDALRFIRIRQRFGSGGSPSTTVDTDSSAFTLTSSWARYTATIAIPSITGKTLGTAGDDRLEVSFCLKASTAQTLDIWGVQVEAGSTATPFRRNANSLQGELAACQRYAYAVGGETLFQFYGIGNQQSTTSHRITIPLPVKMRSVPTSLTVSSNAHFGIDNAQSFTATINTVAIDTSVNSPLSAGLTIGTSGTIGSAGGAVRLLSNNTLSALIVISAEL